MYVLVLHRLLKTSCGAECGSVCLHRRRLSSWISCVCVLCACDGDALGLDLEKHTCLLDEEGTPTGAVGAQVQSGLVRESLVRQPRHLSQMSSPRAGQ